MNTVLRGLAGAVLGDDPRVVGGVVLTLCAAGIAAWAGLEPWWLVIVGVPLVLGWSLSRATRPGSS